MPKKLTIFAQHFAAAADQAVRLVREAEEMCLPDSSGVVVEYFPIQDTHIDYLYELAFLRVFMEWEVFLEETILRCLQGHHTRNGKPVLLPGKTFAKTLKSAKKKLFVGKYKGGYILWGNVDTAMKVIKGHLDNGTALSENFLDRPA